MFSEDIIRMDPISYQMQRTEVQKAQLAHWWMGEIEFLRVQIIPWMERTEFRQKTRYKYFRRPLAYLKAKVV